MTNSKTCFSIVAGTVLLASSLTAAGTENPLQGVTEQDRIIHEGSGITGGVVIGGLVGGPVGAILSAAFGGWVGNQTFKGKENALLVRALEERDKELLTLQAEMRALEARYQIAGRDNAAARVRQTSFQAQARPAPSCCNDTELALHFKTNSAQIESLYDDKLEEFVVLVNQLPEVVISITGHADRRGDSAANLALSQRRVDSVKSRLRSLGTNKAFVQSSAFGESMPQSDDDTLENNFFDRRVTVKIISAGNSYLTRVND